MSVCICVCLCVLLIYQDQEQQENWIHWCTFLNIIFPTDVTETHVLLLLAKPSENPNIYGGLEEEITN